MRLVFVALMVAGIASSSVLSPAAAQEAAPGGPPPAQPERTTHDPEPWYQPTPSFGGNLADALRTRFEKALPSSPAKARIDCYLNTIRSADSDDRLIWWSRICPSHGRDGKPEPVCGIGDLNEEDLHREIKQPEDVEPAGGRLRIFTYLKSFALNRQTHLPQPQHDATVAKDLERVDQDTMLALKEMDALLKEPPDGSDSWRHYRAIRAWIQRKQEDPKSVYACTKL